MSLTLSDESTLLLLPYTLIGIGRVAPRPRFTVRVATVVRLQSKIWIVLGSIGMTKTALDSDMKKDDLLPHCYRLTPKGCTHQTSYETKVWYSSSEQRKGYDCTKHSPK
eukprot:scaffold4396_cov204-Amphora_coffeaeformis.AAC.6